MQESSPARLPIPVAGKEFEFTLRDGMTVGDFQAAVVANTDKLVSDFKLMPTLGKHDPTLPLSQLKQSQFKMEVNGKQFTVYPDFDSLMALGDNSKLELDTSIASSRKIILGGFYKHLEQSIGAGISADQFRAKAEEAVAAYRSEIKTASYLQHLKAALD